MNNRELVKIIKEKSTFYLDNEVCSERVLKAMLAVDRADFIPGFYIRDVYIDAPLPIGYGQTCSQPSMVAFMLDKLKIERGNKILEIGGGCGYAAAVAAHLTGSSGVVYTSEIIEPLSIKLKANVVTAGYDNVVVLNSDGSEGFPEFAPYDRIFLSAGVSSHFEYEKLIDQLAVGGSIIFPERYGNLYLIHKGEKGQTESEAFYGVSFVPLKGKNS